jgi:hypothetical protein
VIARKLMDGMGGTLGVESQYGKGSTFWLDLALAEGPAAAEATGPRILVAEDNGVNITGRRVQSRSLRPMTAPMRRPANMVHPAGEACRMGV